MSEPAVPPPTPSSSLPEERSRGWFVVLAWVVLVGFALFVGGVTAAACGLPAIQKQREGR
jgi:hypothetical protein